MSNQSFLKFKIYRKQAVPEIKHFHDFLWDYALRKMLVTNKKFEYKREKVR